MTLDLTVKTENYF